MPIIIFLFCVLLSTLSGCNTSDDYNNASFSISVNINGHNTFAVYNA